MKLNQTLAAGLIAIAAVVTAQCGGGDAKSSSGLLSLPSSASSVASDNAISTRVVGDTEPLAGVVAELGKIKVCKDGDGSGDFLVSGASGSVSALAAVTIPTGSCVTVAEDSAPAGVSPASPAVNITVEESPATFLSTVFVTTNTAGTISGPNEATNPVTRIVNNFHGRVIVFTNDAPDPPPPTGTEGCTPGFWKAPQHLDSWTTYAPGDDFDTTFGVDFFNPDMTLLQALGLGGGGTAALARHAVAALLNVANADVDYTYTLDQVMAIVQGTGDYSALSVEARKNLLVTANELGCPLS